MAKWVIIIGIEILLFAGPAMIDPEWFTKYASFLVLIGIVILAVGIVWDHLPKALAFINAYNWMKLDTAARYFRDLLDRPTMGSAAEMFDGLVKSSHAKNPLEETFIAWLEVGINQDCIEAWGRPINGSKLIRIRKPVVDRPYSHKRSGTIFSNGEEFEDIVIRRASLASFVTWMETHDRPKDG